MYIIFKKVDSFQEFNSLLRSLITGSPEFVDVAAEVGALLFNMNYCVFVEEQLMSKGLKQQKQAHMNPSMYRNTSV